MKKLLFIITTALTISLSAQTYPAFLAGGTFSNISTDEFDSKMRSGFNAGISFVSYYTEEFQILSEFYYETKGAKIEGREATPFGNELKETYVPVNLNFGSLTWSFIGNYFFKENFGVQFGPHVKLLNYGLAKMSNTPIYLGKGYSKDDMISDHDVAHAMNDILSMDVGLSVGLSAGFSDFIISARYNPGLPPFKPLQDFMPFERDIIIRNTSISFSVTYFIRKFEFVLLFL